MQTILPNRIERHSINYDIQSMLIHDIICVEALQRLCAQEILWPDSDKILQPTEKLSLRSQKFTENIFVKFFVRFLSKNLKLH